MNWINGLFNWRKNRDITVPSGKYAEMIEEELQEYKDSETIEDKIDAIGDIIVLSVNECELEGYNVNLVMNEIVKEISSRLQCPEQAERDWIGNEKWKKSVLPEHQKLWYKADFTNCKL